MFEGHRKTSPAFQFYCKDFLSSSKVQRMTMTERGIYVTLLSHAWLDGSLPFDLDKLARLVGMRTTQFARIWASGPLIECFTERDGTLTNARMERQREVLDQFHANQRHRGKLGGLSKARASGARVRLEPEASTATVSLQNNPSETLAQGVAKRSSSSSTPSSTPKNVQKDVQEGSFHRFQMAYPASRRKGGYLNESLFFDAYQKAGEALFEALGNHVASEQWQTPKLIPGMDTWLKEERWTQRLEPPKAATKSSFGTWRPKGEVAS